MAEVRAAAPGTPSPSPDQNPSSLPLAQAQCVAEVRAAAPGTPSPDPLFLLPPLCALLADVQCRPGLVGAAASEKLLPRVWSYVVEHAGQPTAHMDGVWRRGVRGGGGWGEVGAAVRRGPMRWSPRLPCSSWPCWLGREGPVDGAESNGAGSVAGFSSPRSP